MFATDHAATDHAATALLLKKRYPALPIAPLLVSGQALELERRAAG